MYSGNKGLQIIVTITSFKTTIYLWLACGV